MDDVRLEVTVMDAQREGGCTFCNRRLCDASDATPEYTVYMVSRSMGGMAPRFCAECLGDLVGHIARLVTHGTP